MVYLRAKNLLEARKILNRRIKKFNRNKTHPKRKISYLRYAGKKYDLSDSKLYSYATQEKSGRRR